MEEDAPDGCAARAVIELEWGEPLRGSLSFGQGRRQTFSGWIELAVALDALRYPAGREPAHLGRDGTCQREHGDPPGMTRA